MADLLEYFEAQSRNLDNKEATSKYLYIQDSKFTSCIMFNGVPILPPVMTPRRREEMKSYRRMAMKRENRRKLKHREQLVAKVQSIVAEVEEQRAARKEESVPPSPAGSDTSSSKISPSQPVKSFPSFPFPVKNRNNKSEAEQNTIATRHADNFKTSNEKSAGGNILVRKEQTKDKSNVQSLERNKEVKGQSSKSATHYSNASKKLSQQSSNKGAQPNKQVMTDKNKSKQQTSQIPTPKKGKSEETMSNLKRARSMSSLPNPAKIEGIPVPKPPSSPMTKQQFRRAQLLMSGQFSISQPDLLDIDKSDSENSLSCRSLIQESPSKRREKLLMSSQYSVSNPDLTDLNNVISIPTDKLEKQTKLSPKSKLKSSASTPNLTLVGRRRSKRDKMKDNKDYEDQDQSNSSADHRQKRQDSHLTSESQKIVKNTDNLPEKQGNTEAGIESLSDFASLEDCNSLPQEFGGLPLSTYGQQQIAHSLAKLTKCLNIEDTLSTMTSTGSEIDNTEIKQPVPIVAGQINRNMPGQKTLPVQKISGGHSSETRGRKLPTIPQDLNSDESSISQNQTLSSHNSSVMSTDQGSGSNGNRSHSSVASASIMSSGGSVSGSQASRRMSPKGGKSKVHFSSFLTEISTSASQSLEGKISVRKLDITPQNSIDFTENVNRERIDECSNATSHPLTLKMGTAQNIQNLDSDTSNELIEEQPNSMLGRVALSPETSESPGTPNEYNFGRNGIPFHGYTGEIDYNTSDKENECVNKLNNVVASEGFTHAKSIKESTSASSSKNGVVINNSQGNLMKNVTKLLNSDDGSQCSTLKASQDLVQSRESNLNTQSGSTMQTETITNYKMGTDTHGQYGTNSTDLEKYMRGSSTIGSEAAMPPQHFNVGDSNYYVANESQQESYYGNQPQIDQSFQHVNRSQGHNKSKISPETENGAHNMETNGKPSFTKGHVRTGSYTLPQASPALLQAASQDFTASSSPRNVQRRLNLDNVDPRITQQEQQISDTVEQQNISVDSSTEQQGKAQHIQRYLSQLQNHSQHASPPAKIPESFNNMAANIPGTPLDVNRAIKSFTESLNTVESMSEEELLKIQAEHFDKIRKFLIEQQKQQLEELFVHQRREQMQLQNEIESYHQQLKDQHDISGVEHSPENNAAYGIERHMQAFDVSGSYNPGQTQESQQTTKTYPYISSPSLYFNPRDRENGSDISTFSKATPKQSLQFNMNQSTPSPKPYNPVVRSPIKNPSLPKVSNRMIIPERVHDPDMKRCFDRVSACIKGYLTRRLLRTEKVQELIKTIRDTKNFAYSFQAETPIKRGNFTNQDRNLLDRIIAQLQAALLDIHEIFFIIPVSERMSLIAHSRQLLEEKRLRESNTTRFSVSSSQPKVSSATLKAMERKRRAHEAEIAVFGDMNLRPRSAPQISEITRNSHHNHSIDLSGPLRRHFHFLFSRALRPVSSHGQNAGAHSGVKHTAREKPKTSGTAVGNSKQSQVGLKIKKPVVTAGKTTTRTTTTKTKMVSKPKMKPASAWR